jgi:hypothetical protein
MKSTGKSRGKSHWHVKGQKIRIVFMPGMVGVAMASLLRIASHCLLHRFRAPEILFNPSLIGLEYPGR